MPPGPIDICHVTVCGSLMIRTFADRHTKDLYETGASKRFPAEIWKRSLRRNGKVRPTHPGEFLREDFLPDYGLTTAGLAEALGVSRQTVNELLRERRAVSPEMALRLSRLFGNTPEFWLNAQRAVDLWEAARNNKEKIERIKPLTAA